MIRLFGIVGSVMLIVSFLAVLGFAAIRLLERILFGAEVDDDVNWNYRVNRDEDTED
jgi:hypothetical protein